MSPPDDALLAARLSRRLDWWFAPRWRALLSWVCLTWLMQRIWDGFGAMATDRWFSEVEHVAGISPPLPLRELAAWAHWFFLIHWFEPLALRLNLARGAAWIALRIGSGLAMQFWFPPGPGSPEMKYFVADKVLPMLALIGWRNRPWMSVVAGALSFGAITLLARWPVNDVPDWLWTAAGVFPFAAALLYGTRLLRPEERARA